MTVEITQEKFDELNAAGMSADVNLTGATDGSGMGIFWGALAKAQGKFDVIETNKKVYIKMKSGGGYWFDYANLAQIRAKTTPSLSSHALALVQIVTEANNETCIRTILGHDSGAQIESVLRLRRQEGGDIKDFGGAITYLRRYVAGAMLGVAADDDADSDGQDRVEGGETELTREAPISAEKHPDLEKAKTTLELAQVMNKIPTAERGKYTAYFAQRRAELTADQPLEPTETREALPLVQDDL